MIGIDRILDVCPNETCDLPGRWYPAFRIWYNAQCRGTNFMIHQAHLEAVLKLRLLGSTSRVSDSTGLGWDGGLPPF